MAAKKKAAVRATKSSAKVTKQSTRTSLKRYKNSPSSASVIPVRDSLANVITQMGNAKDKTQYTRPLYSESLSPDEIGHLLGSKLVKRIIDTEGFWATRQGWSTKIDTGDAEKSTDLSKQFDEAHRRLDVKQICRRALSRARARGGSIVLVGTASDILSGPQNSFSEPLEDVGKGIQWLRIYDKSQYEEGPEDFENPDNFGKPQWYTVQGDYKGWNMQMKIHWSRVLTFETDDGESVLHGMYPALREYAIAHHASEIALMEFSVANHKIRGLADMIGQGNEDNVLKRIYMTEFSKSVANARVSDMENEDFAYEARPVSGMGELIDRAQINVCAHSELPNTLLFGVSPGGFGTGEHEYSNLESSAVSVQTDRLEPQLLRLNWMIAKTPGFEIPEGASMRIEFNGIRPKTDHEKMEERKLAVETQKIRAETLALLTTSMITTPEEAAESLAANEDWKIRIDRKDDEQARMDRKTLIEDLRQFKESG